MHKHKHTRRQKGEGTCDQRQEDRSAGQKRHGAVHAPLVLDDVDASVVDSVVALVALVVIVAIFDCRCAEHNQEREPGGDGTEGADLRDELQNQLQQEVDVGSTRKLLKEVDGQERQHSVLGRLDPVFLQGSGGGGSSSRESASKCMQVRFVQKRLQQLCVCAYVRVNT